MKIMVNGNEMNMNDDEKLTSLLNILKINVDEIVVILNDKILKKSEIKDIMLNNNDNVELITFVAGG